MDASLAQWRVLTPVLAIAVAALVVLGSRAIAGERHGASRDGDAENAGSSGRLGLFVALIATAALVVSGVSAYVPLLTGQASAFDPQNGVYRLDGLTAVGTLLLTTATLLTVWASSTYLIVLAIDQAEYYALLLLSLCGMALCVGAESTPLLYVGVELMSVPLFALAGFDRTNQKGQEAGLKLVVAGGVGSATLLYGLALLYGGTGSTTLAGIHANMAPGSGLALIGLGLCLAGLLAKVALVPFHAVAVDATEGAPTPLAAFVAVAPTTTVAIVLVRWLGPEAFVLGPSGSMLFAALSIASVLVGCLMALIQHDVRRMLAYITVAQAGILAIAFVASTPEAYGALLFGLLAQTVSLIGLFCLLTSLASTRPGSARIEDLGGLGRTNPMLAAGASLFLLALAGAPGTIGFWSRYLLFAAGLEAGAIVPVLVAALGTALMLICVLRVIITMYTLPPRGEARHGPASNELGVILFCAAAVLYLGFAPTLTLPGQSQPLTELLIQSLPTTFMK